MRRRVTAGSHMAASVSGHVSTSVLAALRRRVTATGSFVTSAPRGRVTAGTFVTAVPRGRVTAGSHEDPHHDRHHRRRRRSRADSGAFTDLATTTSSKRSRSRRHPMKSSEYPIASGYSEPTS